MGRGTGQMCAATELKQSKDYIETRKYFSPCLNRLSLSRFRLSSSLNISEQATRCQNCLITDPTISIKHR